MLILLNAIGLVKCDESINFSGVLKIIEFTHMVNLPIEYSDKKVTPFGGMSLMKRFVDSIGIREYLSILDLPDEGSNRSYEASHIIESFWLSIWTGASRYIHADWLRYDTTLHDIFGWDKMPSQSTYTNYISI